MANSDGPISFLTYRKTEIFFYLFYNRHNNCACLKDLFSLKKKERKSEREEKSTCHDCYNFFVFLFCQKYGKNTGVSKVHSSIKFAENDGDK